MKNIGRTNLTERIISNRIRGIDRCFVLPRALFAVPRRAALYFAISSSGTACLSAGLEGRFFHAETGIQPFVENWSTLLDFLILNPVVIYYISRTRNAIQGLPLHFAPSSPVVHSTRLVLFLVFAISIMTFYVASFFDGKILDALQTIPGIRGVSITGWIVYAWTTIFIYVLLWGFFVQGNYVYGIAKLCLAQIRYEPLHPDDSGGLRPFAEPALQFLHVMFWLFMIFVVFYVQDRLINQLSTSIRVNVGFFGYVCLSLPLFFFPLLRLHKLMSEARENLVRRLNEQFTTIIGQLEKKHETRAVTTAAQLNRLIGLHKEIRAFTTWPLPVNEMVKSLTYLVAPAIQYLPKLLAFAGFEV